jgi:hypothetical protein
MGYELGARFAGSNDRNVIQAAFMADTAQGAAWRLE